MCFTSKEDLNIKSIDLGILPDQVIQTAIENISNIPFGAFIKAQFNINRMMEMERKLIHK